MPAPTKAESKTESKADAKAESKASDSKAVAVVEARFTPQKQRDLDSAISTITKSFGDGAIMRLGSQVIRPIEVIPTGALAIDLALGVGGVPRGRIVEIYGP
jgi:recombination protein RecA